MLLPLADGQARALNGREREPPAGPVRPVRCGATFSDAKVIGTVTKNTVRGIFGTLSERSLLSGESAVPVASRDEIQTGDAEILANTS